MECKAYKSQVVSPSVANELLTVEEAKEGEEAKAATAEEMAAYTEKAKNGEAVLVNGFEEAYDAAIFNIMSKTKEGIVSAECGDGTVIALDVVLTEALIKEGTVRDIIRQCQLIRKEAGYEVEQRVVMALSSDSDFIVNCLTENKAYMADELLADDIIIGGTIEADLTKTISVADSDITLSVKKA
mgnify:CR=1 FL=1